MRRINLIVAATLLCLLILIGYNTAKSQQPPCMQNYWGLTYESDTLQSFPSLSTGMPYDVLVSYIAVDSVSKYASENQIDEFLGRQTYNDTIQYLMRFYYKTMDYDPILFMKSMDYWSQGYIHRPIQIEDKVLKRILDVSSDKYLHQALLASSYILHVDVTDTLRRPDPAASVMKTVAIATCEVIDTIKGQVLPQCKDISIQGGEEVKNNKDTILSFPNNCLQFEYRLEWHRDQEGSEKIIDVIDSTGKNLSPRLVDTNDVPWIKANKEYIVFLYNSWICKDTYYHFAPVPFLDNSLSFGMYPIENGYVQDLDNDFGLGTSVELSQFKAYLESKIQEIIQYDGN